MPRPSTDAPRFRPLTWILLAIGAFVALVVGASSGIAGLILVAALVGVVTALYTLATGRRSWARLASRRAAAVALAACLVTTGVSASFVPASDVVPTDAALGSPADGGSPAPAITHAPAPTVTPTPTATAASVAFTDEAPADPATVTQPSSDPEVAVPDASATAGTALALLATIPVKGKAPKTGYDRTGDFGTAWLDVDHNGCDTRNDILARDLSDLVRQGPCKVLRGSFTEPYTGKTVDFVRGNATSALVQIDHVVALSNAWQTGAQKLSQAQRISLANDPLNLLAADGRANAQKGDGDAATWLPASKSFRCTYVARQVSVKATYGLWVAPAEHDAMQRVLSRCPKQPAVTSAFAPVVAAPAPTRTPVVTQPVPQAPAEKPAPAPAPQAPSDTYYQNCTDVRAAGAAPIHEGEPGYSRKLDRDGDGIGCE